LPRSCHIAQAVRLNDESLIRKAVKKGARINERREPFTQGEQTPLMTACLSGSVEAVRTLLELKANPKLGEKDGYTCLHGVAFQGRADVARMLLRDMPGAVPNDYHRDGYLPVHRTVWYARVYVQ
jgi:ankyrin repeat protein